MRQTIFGSGWCAGVAVLLSIGFAGAAYPQRQVAINEVVTDPQRDWGGGSFEDPDMPAGGDISSSDEWVELKNTSVRTALNMNGWTLEIHNDSDAPPSVCTLSSDTENLCFSAGGHVGEFQPLEYMVIGNPPGSVSDDVWIVLKDSRGEVVDELEIGRKDIAGDGTADNAPDGGRSSGAADDVENEAIAAEPDGSSTRYVKQRATLCGPNEIPVLLDPPDGSAQRPSSAPTFRWTSEMYELYQIEFSSTEAATSSVAITRPCQRREYYTPDKFTWGLLYRLSARSAPEANTVYWWIRGTDAVSGATQDSRVRRFHF